MQYRVRWQGHPGFTDTWRSVAYLDRVKELIDAYEARIGIQNKAERVHGRDAAIDLEETGDDKHPKRRFFRGRPESSKEEAEVKSAPQEPTAAPAPAEPVEVRDDTADAFPAKSRVEVQYGDGTWWKGTVLRTYVSRTQPPERVIIVEYDDKRWPAPYSHGLRDSPVRLLKEKKQKTKQPQVQLPAAASSDVAEQRRLRRLERIKRQLS